MGIYGPTRLPITDSTHYHTRDCLYLSACFYLRFFHYLYRSISSHYLAFFAEPLSDGFTR